MGTDNILIANIVFITTILTFITELINLWSKIKEKKNNKKGEKITLKQKVRIINIQITINLFVTIFIICIAAFSFTYRNNLIIKDKITEEDRGKLKNLINSEAKAVETQDTILIKNIFDPNALITDRTNGKTVLNPLKFYQDKFRDIKFIKAEHTNINIEELTAGFARISCSSNGEFVDIKSGSVGSFNNVTPNADLFELKKDNSDNWHIIYFSFR